MSIRSEITRIENAKSDIAEAIADKGVTVPSGTTLDGMAALISDIETGSDPVLQTKTVTPTTSKQTITADSGYDGLDTVTVNAMPTATQATPSITVSSAGLITAKAIQSAGYVASGTKQATKQLTTQAAQTITPGTSNKTIASGRYLTGTQTIKGDANLVAGNIKSGVSIFGVAGSYEGSGGGGSSGGGAEPKTCHAYIFDSTAFGNLNGTARFTCLNTDGTLGLVTCEKDAFGWDKDNVLIGSTIMLEVDSPLDTVECYEDSDVLISGETIFITILNAEPDPNYPEDGASFTVAVS